MSLIAYLERWAASQPAKCLFSFLDVNGKQTDRYSFSTFHHSTRNLAHYLSRQTGLAYGDRALLVYPPGLDLLVAFFACARLGAIPVPVHPPTLSSFEAGLIRLILVANDCGTTVALTNRAFSESFQNRLVRCGRQPAAASLPPQLTWITTDDVPTTEVQAFDDTPNPVLFLQYTSGSTSDPKGVVVTHQNVVHNAVSIVTETPIGVSWLPQYHDMGLIGFYLFAVVVGGTTYGFSPLDFLKRPALWLQTISRVGATYASSPNFGFDYCLRPGKVSPRDLCDVNLGSLRALINGAEPVSAETYRAFFERFREYGLRADAVVSAYGLAESTLAVTTHGRRIVTLDKHLLHQNVARFRTGDDEQDDVVPLVSCGTPLTDLELRIVAPESRTVVPEGEIGEIWVSGPSVCMGYWNRPDLTAEVFGNYPVNGCKRGTAYLRTGDLGFVHDQELYVCGRLKDLIIVRGVNYYPHDIEAAVESASGDIRRGGVAAFAGDADREALVVVAEVRSAGPLPDPAGIARVVRAKCQVEPDAIALVPPGAVRKTTSGKTARGPTRERYLDGTLPTRFTYRKPVEPPPTSALERFRERLEQLLQTCPGASRERETLADLGIDSLGLVQLFLDFESVLEQRGAGELVSELDMTLLQQLTPADVARLLDLLELESASALDECRLALRQSRSAHHTETHARMRVDAATIPTTLEPIDTENREVTTVLFTGATGFFGPFLLSSLLHQTPYTYVVLVRAASDAHGKERIQRSLREAGLLTPGVAVALESRVQVVHGDISREHLGLSDERWTSLAREVDAVCHNAALVNYVMSYETHHPHNVAGTRELLRFAQTGRRKSFDFVSSTFIFGWTATGLLLESDNNDGMANLDFGYAQSKWVAEQLVFAAGRQGVPVRVYRPALISVSSQGIGDDGDAAIRLLAFMINHGVAVESTNQVSMLPVDVAAENLAAIVARRHSIGTTLHLTVDRYYNIRDLTRVLTRDYGYRFTYYDIPGFVAVMNRRCTEEDLLYPLLDFFNRSAPKIAAMQLKRYSNQEYRRAKALCGVTRAEPSLEETVSYLVRYMRRRGFIPAR